MNSIGTIFISDTSTIDLESVGITSEMLVGNPHYVILTGFVVIAIGLFAWSTFQRQRALNQFGNAGSSQRHSQTSSSFRRFVSASTLVLGILALSLAVLDIRWGKTTYEVPQKGLEVVFALDVSRSMLAQDAVPNRLDRAKQQIKDMVDEMAGDRIGLVIFAGEADQAVPLTSHYEDFKQTLDEVGPHSIPKGGSQLGVAIQAAADAFISKTNEHKTIVLFTDGEDQESEPVALARRLHSEEGLRIFTVGLGDLDQGARIPDTQSSPSAFVQHQGQQVWSKQNGQILKEIATDSQGAYIPAGTKRVNMADVYHGYVANVQRTEFETAKIKAYIPRFQWFAAVALMCLLIEVWLASGRSKTIVSAAVLFILLFPTRSWAQERPSIESQINQANKLVRQQKNDEAITSFNQIEIKPTNDSVTQNQLDYNMAVAHYQNSDFETAQSLFAQSAKSADRQIAASSRYNLGNCHYEIALLSRDKEPDQAIESLENAIDHYRSGLRLDRTNTDARANIELARKLIEQIKEAKKEAKKEDQKEDQKKQEQNKDQQNDKRNQEDQQDSKSDQEQSDQQQPKQEQSDQQQSDQEQSKQEQSNQQQSEQQQSDQHSGSEPQNSSQSDPSQSSPDQKPESSNESEADRSDVDENPNDHQDGKLTSVNQNSQPSERQLQNQPNADRRFQMTEEEALKLLQNVRDRDMLRRLKQQRRQRYRRVRVEKDW